LDVLFKKYTDFLNKKNGWTVMNILNNKTIKSISAVDSEGTSVLVNLVQNSVTKLNQVTISFVYAKNPSN
jgi:ABC-type transporter Mla MlaB component